MENLVKNKETFFLKKLQLDKRMKYFVVLLFFVNDDHDAADDNEIFCLVNCSVLLFCQRRFSLLLLSPTSTFSNVICNLNQSLEYIYPIR